MLRDCGRPKACHLSDSESHMVRDCTKLRPYAAVLKGDYKRRDNGERKERGKEAAMDEEACTGVENEPYEREGGVEKRGVEIQEEERKSEVGETKVEEEGRLEPEQQRWLKKIDEESINKEANGKPCRISRGEQEK